MGAVLNDTPVACQIRDLTEPAGENDSPRFHQTRTQNRMQEIVPNLRFLLFPRDIFALPRHKKHILR